jgi:hypothetical protein
MWKRNLEKQVSGYNQVHHDCSVRGPMSELKFVSWKEIFQRAIEETDRDKRSQLVQQADFAVFQRQQQLFNCDRHREELSALNAATEALRVIKHAARALEKSGWRQYRTKSA